MINTVIYRNQSIYSPGGIIHDSIMTRELIKGYNRRHISLRCMIQMDMQKTYDSVEWDALKNILKELGFPLLFIEWVMLGVRTVSYKYHIGGNRKELVVEYLTNLFFADDILLFVRGDIISVKMPMKHFSIFSESTWLRVNNAKSCVYFGGVCEEGMLLFQVS